MLLYPKDELEQPGALLYQLGSFWYSQCEDAEVLNAEYHAACTDFDQQVQLTQDASDVLSRQKLPVHRRQWWRLIRILESGRGSIDAAKLQYGQDGVVYGGGYTYGQLATAGVCLYPISTGQGTPVRASLMMNRLTDPTATLFPDIDFQIYSGYLVFGSDPFEDTRFATRVVYDAGGTPVDRELALWAYCVDTDSQYLWNHAGYVLGRSYPTSQSYKDYVNAVWDMHTYGPTNHGLRRVIAGALGMPLVEKDGEVVETILSYGGLTVITDRAVYQFGAGAIPSVTVGDMLHAGDTLTEDLVFAELSNGTADLTGIAGLVLGPGMLRDPYLGALYFENKDSPLEYVGPDIDGVVEVRFPVSGFPLDVEQFWDLVHIRGKASGSTLARLLDTRTGGTGEPQDENLPPTINPLATIVELLSANFMIVRVQTTRVPASAPGMKALGVLREIMPPHMAVILYVSIEAAQDTYESDNVENGVIQCAYGVTAPAATMMVDDPAPYTYVMVDGAFVLVEDSFIVVGSGVPNLPDETYGHLTPTARQVATDCA